MVLGGETEEEVIKKYFSKNDWLNEDQKNRVIAEPILEKRNLVKESIIDE